MANPDETPCAVPGANDFVLVRPDGSVAFATPSLWTWLDNRRAATLGRLVRGELDASPEDFDADVVVMHSSAELLYLVCVRPRPARRLLSRRQLEVAELAARGATVDEIASALAIAANTVRHHLKATYSTLGVSNRVELARAV